MHVRPQCPLRPHLYLILNPDGDAIIPKPVVDRRDGLFQLPRQVAYVLGFEVVQDLFRRHARHFAEFGKTCQVHFFVRRGLTAFTSFGKVAL